MATGKEGKKIVEIKENEAVKANGTPENQGQLMNVANGTEENATEVKFFQHPFKWVKKKFEDHPVVSTVVTVGGVGLLGVGLKAVADALGGGNSDDEDDEDELNDEMEDEDEADEEEI